MGGDSAGLFSGHIRKYCLLSLAVARIGSLEVIDFSVGYPGRVHDLTAWASTAIAQNPTAFHLSEDGDTFLICADAAFSSNSFPYFLNPRPLTSLTADPVAKARNHIERLFGVVQGRFGCLRAGLRVTTQTEATLITSVCF